MGNWQIYAAVSGSAVAMATGASAAIISSSGTGITREPTASARLAQRNLTSSNNAPLRNDVKNGPDQARMRVNAYSTLRAQV